MRAFVCALHVCAYVMCVSDGEPDNKGKLNVAALALITYLWIRLISKPTADSPL